MTAPSYRFGPFFLDREDYRLMRGDAAVDLTPKQLDLLLHLASHAGALVTKEDLLDAVWPDANVTDNALAQAVSELRDALDDDPSSPRFIKTIARRGYRFIAPVQEQLHGSPENGALTTVSAQSMPQPPSAARSERPPPVALSTVSGESQRHSEALHLPSLAGEYKQVTVLCGGLADALALAGPSGA